MTKREWLKRNRKELDAIIRKKLKNPDFIINDHERELWLLNDESLYNWARSEGVNL